MNVSKTIARAVALALLTISGVAAQYDELFAAGPACTLDQAVPEFLYFDEATQAYSKRLQDFKYQPDLLQVVQDTDRIQVAQCHCAQRHSRMAERYNPNNEKRAQEQKHALENAFCPSFTTSCNVNWHLTQAKDEDGNDEDYYRAVVHCESERDRTANAMGVFLPISVIMLALLIYKCIFSEQGFLVRRQLALYGWMACRRAEKEGSAPADGQEEDPEVQHQEASDNVDQSSSADPNAAIRELEAENYRRMLQPLAHIPHQEFSRETLKIVEQRWPNLWGWLGQVAAVHLQADINVLTRMYDDDVVTPGNGDEAARLILRTMTVTAKHLDQLDDDDESDETDFEDTADLSTDEESQRTPIHQESDTNESDSVNEIVTSSLSDIDYASPDSSTSDLPSTTQAQDPEAPDVPLTCCDVAASPEAPACLHRDSILQHGEKTCAVCIDSVEVGDVVGNISCGHLFHKDCLKMWLTRENKCPLCQRPNIAKIALPQMASDDTTAEEEEQE